ncbi:MAG TPA: hypothetical protein VL128_11565 [Candidatus Eisenbacteria bacterium]|nr:hypothetical protein [Candidatus Eisenbacteria bacterium]
MQGLRVCLATLAMAGLATSPAWGDPKPTASLGTIVTASHARVGDSDAAVGTTVFSGDRLSTEHEGSVQIRAGAARLLLQSASAAVVNENEGAPSARLLAGTATFSTGNANAFTLYASRAAIRAQSDAPTIGQVTYLGEKELLVTSKRGPLTITVDGDTQLIEEGASYHVVLEPPTTTGQGAEGAGSGKKDKGMGGTPLKAGRSYFLIGAVAVTGVITAIGIHEALESPSRP